MYTKHIQQSTEDTKHTEKKPQTNLYNCKITGIQNNSQTPTLICISHLGSTHGKRYTYTTSTKYKTTVRSKMGPSWLFTLHKRFLLTKKLGPTFLQNLPSKYCHPYPTLFTNTPQNYTAHLINKNSYRYRQLSTSTDTYKYSYSPPPRTITDWNSLPPTRSVCDSNGAGLTRYLLPSL